MGYVFVLHVIVDAFEKLRKATLGFAMSVFRASVNIEQLPPTQNGFL